jgi:hypothetical protein
MRGMEIIVLDEDRQLARRRLLLVAASLAAEEWLFEDDGRTFGVPIDQLALTALESAFLGHTK